MSKKLEETLGLPSMDSFIGTFEEYDDGDDGEHELSIPTDFSQVPAVSTVDDDIAALGGADHAKKMDDLYEIFKTQGEMIFDLAQDIEVTKAARMFEVANAVLKNSMDAQNSKRDSQLKTMKFALDKQRLNLDQQSAGIAPPTTIETQATVFMDRNAMLKKIREKRAAENTDNA